MMTNGGAQFEISVDGKPRSLRDLRETAFEAAQYLKSLNPHSEVAVRDLQTNISTPVILKSENSPIPMKRK
jgi:hypothetical protein